MLCGKKYWIEIQVMTCQIQEIKLNTDNIFICNFVNEKVEIPIRISLKFITKNTIDGIPALFWIKAWGQTSDKPLSEAMMS